MLNELLEFGKSYRVRVDAHLALFGTPCYPSNTTMIILEKVKGRYKVRYDVFYAIPNYYELLTAEEIQQQIRDYKLWEVNEKRR